MRIWDVEPERLCRQHLLGEHRELHAIWKIFIENKKGYRNHPETKRWEGKLAALYLRHEAEVAEIKKRGWNHNSPLNKSLAKDTQSQNEYVNSYGEQLQILKEKNCLCRTTL